MSLHRPATSIENLRRRFWWTRQTISHFPSVPLHTFSFNKISSAGKISKFCWMKIDLLVSNFYFAISWDFSLNESERVRKGIPRAPLRTTNYSIKFFVIFYVNETDQKSEKKKSSPREQLRGKLGAKELKTNFFWGINYQWKLHSSVVTCKHKYLWC